jgi:hypothetical protein
MYNWCICWFFKHIFTDILTFKGLTTRRLYKSLGVKGLINVKYVCRCTPEISNACNKLRVHNKGKLI